MICDECGTKEALDAMGLTEGSSENTAYVFDFQGESA